MSAVKKVTVRLPGSTTNLGPGFDTLGLALAVYTTVSFEVTEKAGPIILLQGKGTDGLSTQPDNLIYKIFRDYYSGPVDRPADQIKITIETEIPLARGLGSSSTAILAALWAAQALSSTAPPERDPILAQAARIEGHPDNVAACLMGGFIVSGYRHKGHRALTARFEWPDKWHTLVVVPPYELSTHEARRVLPRRVSMAQAVNNVQRTGLLISAVTHEDEDLLSEALHDELHEPFRIHLVPELADLRRELASMPVLGCVLSGAGSSTLVIVHEKHKEEIKSFLEQWAQNRPQRPTILDLTVDKKGLVATYEH